jgi:hypothetical protein
MAERFEKLNVGGTIFITSLDTLTKDPESMLARFLSFFFLLLSAFLR